MTAAREREGTRKLIVFSAAAFLLAFSTLPARLGRPGAFVAELVMVIAGALLALRAARPWLEDTGDRRIARVAVVLLTLLSLGQIVRSKKLFPLMPFTMYARVEQDEARFYEYVGEHRSGKRERFRPSTVIATLGRARIVKGLARELDSIAEREAEGREATRERARLDAVMSALVAYYNRSHPGDPIVRVEAIEVVLPPPYAPSAARRRHVMDFSYGSVR